MKYVYMSVESVQGSFFYALEVLPNVMKVTNILYTEVNHAGIVLV